MSDSDDFSSPANYPKNSSYRSAVNKILEARKKLENQMRTARSNSATSSAVKVVAIDDASGKKVRVLKLQNGGKMTVTKKTTGVTYVLEVNGSRAVLEKVPGDHMALVVSNEDGFVVRSLGIEL